MISAQDLKGALAIMPTPAKEGADRLDATNTVDLDETARLSESLVRDGAAGIMALGTMVSFEPNDLPIENRCDCRAMRRAQSAKTAQRFRALSGIQHCVQNNLTLWRLSMVARNPSGSGVLRNLPRI